MVPDFEYESRLWNQGMALVGGIDEVGRGCFAGPVHVACVGFCRGTVVPTSIQVNDSKKLTHKTRKVANVWIKENSSFCGVGEASVEEIDSDGINGAIQLAARRAINNAEKDLGNSLHYLLIDAIEINDITHLPNSKQISIIKGDSLSLSIAAASIVAKVARDELMETLSRHPNYVKYGWDANKGYGTKSHRDAILKYGVTDMHRKQFVNTFIQNSSQRI